ncbi:FeoB-associated Cys-rich membrane protein [Flavobacterium pedocola]
MISFQEIIVYLLLGVALAFLWKKFFGKKKNDKDCGNGGCGCS